MAPSFVDIDMKRYVCESEPSECPLCHFSVLPKEEGHTVIRSSLTTNHLLEVVYKCPRSECGHLFIASYRSTKVRDTVMGHTLGVFKLTGTAPCNPQLPKIPAEVAAISETFVEIYSQALAAEAYGLQQVAGVGLRKALEFLVKDYSVSLHKDAEEKIKAALLSVCINNYVDSPQVKLCAKRATWLGNDETHYERRWIDKDITNLKELIVLTINSIHNDLLAQKYVEEMPEK